MMEFDTSEEAIKEFVLSLLSGPEVVMERDEIKMELIKKKKCTLSDADSFVSKLDEMGIELCDTSYDLLDMNEFARMRGFIQ